MALATVEVLLLSPFSKVASVLVLRDGLDVSQNWFCNGPAKALCAYLTHLCEIMTIFIFPLDIYLHSNTFLRGVFCL